MNRCDIGSDGKTPLQRLHGRRDNTLILKFGERILYMPAKPGRGGKWEPRVHPGVFVGILNSSSEAVVVTEQGLAIKTRSANIRRVPKSERWDAGRILEMRGTRWSPGGTRWSSDGSDNAFDIQVGGQEALETGHFHDEFVCQFARRPVCRPSMSEHPPRSAALCVSQSCDGSQVLHTWELLAIDTGLPPSSFNLVTHSSFAKPSGLGRVSLFTFNFRRRGQFGARHECWSAGGSISFWRGWAAPSISPPRLPTLMCCFLDVLLPWR